MMPRKFQTNKERAKVDFSKGRSRRMRTAETTDEIARLVSNANETHPRTAETKRKTTKGGQTKHGQGGKTFSAAIWTKTFKDIQSKHL